MTPAAKREAVAHLCDVHEVSQRRACKVLEIDRSSVCYSNVRPDDTDLRKAIRDVARERRRFGYRRIQVILEREGICMNHKKLRRIYCEEKLQVRKRGGRKRALGTRRPMVLPSGINERWSLDFVSDAFTDGRRFRILAVIDDYSRECLALEAIHLCLAGVRSENLTRLSPDVAASPKRLSRMTARSSRVWRYSNGAKKRRSVGTTSRLASPNKTALLKALRVASGTNA